MPTYTPTIEGASLSNPIPSAVVGYSPTTSATSGTALPGEQEVATKAPSVTVSGSTATKDIQSNIAPVITQATSDMKAQADKKALATQTAATAVPKTQQQLDEASGYHNVYGYDPTTGARLGAVPQNSNDNNANPELAAVLNTPSEGKIFAYQADGTKVEIPRGTTPEQYGMFSKPPIQAGQSATTLGSISNAVPLDDGTQVALLGNGTYAKLDANGNFLNNITADEYASERNSSNRYQKNLEAQAADGILAKYDQAVNGAYPLAPWQQDQLNSVKQQYAELIAKQTIANKNFEGGTRTFQGLLGMSEYSPGVAMGAIKDAVDQGLSKIASLNSELAGTLAKMTAAFQSDNVKMLKEAYDLHNDRVTKRQEAIDKIEERIIAAKKDQRDFDQRVKEFDQRTKDDAARLEFDKLKEDNLMSYREKEQALAKMQMSETKRHNLATELEAEKKRLQDAMGEYFDPNTPFASTISTVSRNVSRLDRGNFMKQVSDSAKRGDWKTMLIDIKNEVNNGLPAADRTKLNAHENSISYLKNMRNLLDQYVASGGDTGILKGKYQDISTRLGQLATDPKYTALATAMNDNFVRFRADITGAAFSPAESRGYEALVPSGDKSIDLNKAVIDGALMYAKQQADAVYEQKMGKDGYDNLSGLVQSEDAIQNYVNNATPQDQQRVAQMVADKVPYAEIIKFFGIEK